MGVNGGGATAEGTPAAEPRRGRDHHIAGGETGLVWSLALHRHFRRHNGTLRELCLRRAKLGAGGVGIAQREASSLLEDSRFSSL